MVIVSVVVALVVFIEGLTVLLKSKRDANKKIDWANAASPTASPLP